MTEEEDDRVVGEYGISGTDDVGVAVMSNASRLICGKSDQGAACP